MRAYHHTYGLPTLTTNCSNNYGRFQFPEKLIPLMILNALDGKPLPVYGDGQNVRDWLYVEDHCEAIARCCATGASRRNLQHRRLEREAPTSKSCKRSATLWMKWRRGRSIAPQVDHVCEGSSRPRPALCHGRKED